MSNREKAAWASLLTTAAIWGYYFVKLGLALSAGEADVGAFIGLFARCVVASIVVAIVVAAVFASRGQDLDAPGDERDRQIELRATRAAYALLSAGALLASLSTPFVTGFAGRLFDGDPSSGVALVVGNLVLGAVLLSELVKSGGQILLYRTGR